jgi:2-oxoglutarate dehydrogenase E1 component
MKNVIFRHSQKLWLQYAGREASASPAAGYAALHNREQEQLLKDALKLN